MGIYLYGTEHLLYEEDVSKMFDIANPQRKALIAVLWLTGARPGEIIKLKKEDIKATETSCEITLYTSKLKKADDTGFATKSRTLVFERPNIYVDTLLEYANTIPLPPSTSSILFPLTTKWVQNAVKNLAMKTMGQRITPSHFRHTWKQNKKEARKRTPEKTMTSSHAQNSEPAQTEKEEQQTESAPESEATAQSEKAV